MYKVFHAQYSIDYVYAIHKNKIFNRQKKLIIQNESDFIFNDFKALHNYRNFIDILEIEFRFKDVIKYLKVYDTILIINGKFNNFENEFLTQLCILRKFKIFNFVF